MDTKYRVAICDDEPLHIEMIRHEAEDILKSHGCPQCVYTFSNERALLDAVKRMPNAFDLILLDILLGERDGVDVARELRSIGCASTIVFVTVTSDFAHVGYEVNAHRYVLKPINRATLESAIMSAYKEKQALRPITVRMGNLVHNLSANDIYYIETRGRGVRMHLRETNLDLPQKISEIEELLPNNLLVRCHKSYILNISYIQRIRRYEASVPTEPYIPVGRKYYDEVKDSFMHFLAK